LNFRTAANYTRCLFLALGFPTQGWTY